MAQADGRQPTWHGLERSRAGGRPGRRRPWLAQSTAHVRIVSGYDLATTMAQSAQPAHLSVGSLLDAIGRPVGGVSSRLANVELAVEPQRNRGVASAHASRQPWWCQLHVPVHTCALPWPRQGWGPTRPDAVKGRLVSAVETGCHNDKFGTRTGVAVGAMGRRPITGGCRSPLTSTPKKSPSLTVSGSGTTSVMLRGSRS